MNKDSAKKKTFLRWRRTLPVLLVAAAVPLLAIALAGPFVNRQLGAEVAKIASANEPLTLADIQRHAAGNLPTGDDADYYRQALAAISPDHYKQITATNALFRGSMTSSPADQFPDELRQRALQTLAKFRPVLQKLDKAAELPLSGFDICTEQSMLQCTASLQRVQAAASLLSLRTLHLTLAHNHQAAADSGVTTLKMMRILDSYPIMVVYTTKTTLLAAACKDIQLLLEHTRPSEKTLAQLQNALAQTFSADELERMFLAERVYRIETARNLIPKDIASKLLPKEIPDLPDRLSLPRTFRGRLRIRHHSTRYLRDMAWLIAAARLPLPQPLNTIAARLSKQKPKTETLLLTGAKFAFLTTQTLAHLRCTILVVAVERRRRSTSGLPDSLDELVPAYIDAVPLDPFTGKKLLYHADGQDYTIYSTGINRRDDQGFVTTTPDRQIPQDIGLRITPHKPEKTRSTALPE